MNTLTKKYSSILAFQCIGILFAFNSISCRCNDNPGTNQPSNANILMQVPTDPLIGDKKTVEVTFTLADSNQEASLEGLKLRVTLQETGGVGSQISYPSAAAMTQLDKPLQQVLHLEKLSSSTSPCKVPFTFVITDAKTTQLEAKFELVNQTDHLIHEGTVIWKAIAQPIDLALTLTTPDKLQDDQKTISLQIRNKGTEKTAHNQLKLKVTRQEGNSAELLYGQKRLGKQDVYLVDLPTLTAQATLPYELTINPKQDSKVTFVLELIYQGKNISSPITVTWKKTHVLQIDNFYHSNTTGQVSCNIHNIGTEAVNHVKVSCTTQTPGAQLAGSASQEIIIGDLKPNEKKVDFELGNLNLGGANKSAAFVFTLSYEEEGIPKTMPAIVQTFTKADIGVSVSTSYDKDSRKVEVTIANSWLADKAEGLKLVYKNKSADAEGKLATLDNQQEHTLDIGDLDSGEQNKQNFTLDLKEAEAATFYFEVQYDNNPLETTIETFHAQPIDLALEFDNENLYGAGHEIKLKIKEKSRRPIKIEDLKLVVQQESGEAATISKNLGGAAISEIIGADLGKLGDELTLYVNPTAGAKAATFTFQLQYKGKDIGEPEVISWQEYNLWIEGSKDRLIGDEEGSFTVHSDAPIDLSALTANLESEQGTVFELIKLDGQVAGASLPLDQVIYVPTDPINFKITQKNGQQKAKVNIIIRRGTIELARKEFNWVDQGIELVIKIDKKLIEADKEGTITIENTTNNAVDLHTIQIKLSNTADCPIILGNASGATIHKTLAELVDQDELTAQEEVKIPIKLATNDSLQDKLVSGATLVFLDSQGEILKKEYLLFHAIHTILNEIGVSSNKITKKIKKNKDDIAFLVKISSPIEKAAKALENLPQKLNEMIKRDAGYQNLLNRLNEDNTDLARDLEKSRIDTQTAISNIIINNSKEVSALKKSIKERINLTKGLTDVDKIVQFLSADYDKNESMDQQSIRGLYEHYNELIARFKDSLDNAGITELKPLPQDSPGIKEVKTHYQKLMNDLPAFKKEVQEAFTAGFEVLKSGITAKQQETQEVIKQKSIDNSHNLLMEQNDQLKKLVGAEKNLLQTSPEGLGLNATSWGNFLSASYQNLVGQFVALIEFDEDQYLEATLGFALDTRDKVKQLRQENPTETTKQAATKSTQAAIAITEVLKQKQGENHIFKTQPIKDLLQQLNQELTQLQS